jgi:type IV fimbrial biogenesis protein FimT
MKRIRGFTIIEMMVTVLILGIISAAAAPAFTDVIRRARIDANNSKITGALAFARSESVSRNANVSICTLDSNGGFCDGDEDWSQGWIVFDDINGNGDFDDDGDTIDCEETDDCLLRIWESLPDTVELLEIEESSNSLTFDDNGTIGLGTDFTLQLKVYGCGVGEQRTISLEPLGRARLTVGDC